MTQRSMVKEQVHQTLFYLLNMDNSFIIGSKSKKDNCKWWKALCDFVDNQAIEDALKMVESDHSVLDVCQPRQHNQSHLLNCPNLYR